MNRVRVLAASAVALASAVVVTGRAGTLAGSADKLIPLPGARTVSEYSQCKGYKKYGVPLVTPLTMRRTYRAVVTTNKGPFTVTFWPHKAPTTVLSFIFLAQHRYFDSVPFHRVLPGFVIQGGDPTGTGYCGPGYTFKDENLHQIYHRGDLAMANSGANTNGSQFFVVLRDHVLDRSPNYSIFGHVTSGMSTIDRIAGVPTGPDLSGQENSRPLTKVYMKSVRITVH